MIFMIFVLTQTYCILYTIRSFDTALLIFTTAANNSEMHIHIVCVMCVERYISHYIIRISISISLFIPSRILQSHK